MAEPTSPPERSPSSPLGERDFMRLLMGHEPALRAFPRPLLPDWTAVDEVLPEASLIL